MGAVATKAAASELDQAIKLIDMVDRLVKIPIVKRIIDKRFPPPEEPKLPTETGGQARQAPPPVRREAPPLPPPPEPIRTSAAEIMDFVVSYLTQKPDTMTVKELIKEFSDNKDGIMRLLNAFGYK